MKTIYGKITLCKWPAARNARIIDDMKTVFEKQIRWDCLRFVLSVCCPTNVRIRSEPDQTHVKRPS